MGEDLLKLHVTYFEEDVRLAEEHRFSHEFGSISSHLNTTLNVNFKDIVKKSTEKKKKGSHGAVSVPKAESLMQSATAASKNKFDEALSASASSKNKFEEALNNVTPVTPKPPSTPKTQLTRNLNQGSRIYSSALSSQSQSEVLESSINGDEENVQDLGHSTKEYRSSQGQSHVPGSVNASTVHRILQREDTEMK